MNECMFTCNARGVNLRDCEPGQRGEDEVEEVLAHVDHDVVVLEDALHEEKL